MTTVLAATDAGGELGALALYLTFAWLASAIISAYLSDRKGYGERPGLASGLLLNAAGILIWLVFPAKQTSMWKTHGPFGTTRKGGTPVGQPDAPASESASAPKAQDG